MALINSNQTILLNNFRDFLANSSSYKNSFSYNGSELLLNYLDNLSEDIGENIEYDPIAFCCEFTEYENLTELLEQYPDYSSLEEIAENTQVISENWNPEEIIIIADF